MDLIHAQVVEVIADEFNLEDEKVLPSSKLEADFGADSLDLVELAIGLEERFEIDIPDDDIEKVITVEDVCKYVERKLGTKKKGGSR